MFLVVDAASRTYVFTEEDPRNDEYGGSVEEDVSFEDAITLCWQIGGTTPLPCLGRCAEDGRNYQAFATKQECLDAGFTPLGPNYSKLQNWKQFLDSHEASA